MSKKLISMLLSVVMLITGISIVVYADSAPKDSDSLLLALNIINDKVAEKAAAGENLTRADAAYYALQVTGHSHIISSKTKFADVTANTSYADAINYCVDLGMVAAGEYYRPDDEVTMAEFLKMIEAGLGYSQVAEILGGFPDGNMTLASRLKLTSGVSSAANGTVAYKQLSRLLSNVLMSSYIDLTNISSSATYEISSDTNVLYEVFDVYKATGVVTANAVTTLTVPTGVGDNHIKIEDDLFMVEPELYYGISKLLGYSINAWILEDKTAAKDTIICYEVRSSVTTEDIHAEDFEEISDGVLSYYKGTSLKKETLPASCKIIYNGKAIEAEINGDIFNNRWGNVVLIKEDGNNISTIVITAYDNYYVSSVDKKNFICADNSSDDKKISFADNKELSEYAYFRDNAGNKLSFNDISVGSVLSVAQNGNYYDCIIVKESFTGILETMATDDDGFIEIYVNNNYYKLSPEMANSRAMELGLGNTYKFYLDGDGRIAAAEPESLSSDSMRWVYLINIIESEEYEDVLYFKVLTSSNERATLQNASRIKVDGDIYKNVDRTVIRNIFTKNKDGGDIIRQPMKVEVDTNGDIIKIDTAYFNDGKENESDSAQCFYNDDLDTLYCKGNMGTFGMSVKYSGSTVVFSIPSSDPDEFAAIGSDIFVTDTQYNISAYNSDKNSRTAEVIVCADNVVSTKPMWMSDYLTIVTKITTEEDDNEIVTTLTGYQKGVETKWTLTGADVLKVSPDNKYLSSADGTVKVGRGDAIRYSTDKDGKINGIQLIYDHSEREYHQPASTESSDGIFSIESRNYGRMQIGLVTPFRIMDGALISAVDSTKTPNDANQKYTVHNLTYFKIYEVDTTGDNGFTVKVVSSSDIKDWYNYGTDSNTDVLMRCRYDEGRDLIIYKY